MKRLVLSFAICVQIFAGSCSHSVSPALTGEVSFELSSRIAPGYSVTAIALDGKGTAWLGTLNRGVLKYDGTLTVFNSQNTPLPDSNHVWEIAVDKNDVVWIASDKGLIKYDGTDFTVYDASNSPLLRGLVNSVAVDNDNVLWLSSPVFEEGCLMNFDGTTWNLFTRNNSSLPGSMVWDIDVDSHGGKWVAVNDGINSCGIVSISGDTWTVYDEEEFGFEPYYFGNLACGPGRVCASIDYRLSSDRT